MFVDWISEERSAMGMVLRGTLPQPPQQGFRSDHSVFLLDSVSGAVLLYLLGSFLSPLFFKKSTRANAPVFFLYPLPLPASHTSSLHFWAYRPLDFHTPALIPTIYVAWVCFTWFYFLLELFLFFLIPTHPQGARNA